jgi:hypothetical protein
LSYSSSSPGDGLGDGLYEKERSTGLREALEDVDVDGPDDDDEMGPSNPPE